MKSDRADKRIVKFSKILFSDTVKKKSNNTTQTLEIRPVRPSYFPLNTKLVFIAAFDCNIRLILGNKLSCFQCDFLLLRFLNS